MKGENGTTISKAKVYAFDFDGTLTRQDTLIAFIRFARGTGRLLVGLLFFSPILILMKLRLYPNWKAKQQFFSWFFKGISIDEFNDFCRNFALQKCSLLRPKGIDELKKALAEGAKVIIVSASIENWVRPFFEQLFADSLESGQLQIACTQIDVRHFMVKGKFLTKNCYGAEKVKRIERVFPHRNTYWLIAYGDSRGDQKMFEYADEKYVKPFRDKPSEWWHEVLRFCIVGILATIIQAGVYLVLVSWLAYVVANTVAYVVSFIFNYIASTRYTFKVKPTMKRGAGFVLSHIVNYLLQTGTLSLLIWVGMDKRWALLPMFCICVPVNFILVRYFLKKRL